jgi:predicted nucleic acid-binding protein
MILFDTNLLAYVHDSSSKNHEKAEKLRNAALKGKLEACISYQNISELYSVLTNPLKLAGPYKANEAAEICHLYINSKNIKKILPTEQSYSEALRLAGQAGVTARKIFDYLLIATALENGVDTIYTENTKDFEPFKSIKTINPFLEK